MQEHQGTGFMPDKRGVWGPPFSRQAPRLGL